MTQFNVGQNSQRFTDEEDDGVSVVKSIDKTEQQAANGVGRSKERCSPAHKVLLISRTKSEITNSATNKGRKHAFGG